MFKVVTAFALFAAAAYAQGPGINVGVKPRIADSAVAAFGEYKSPLIFDGFLFINGRYVKPPYSVQYRGNAVTINGILVDRPIRWFGDDSDATAQPAISSATQQNVLIQNDSARETAVVEVAAEAKPKAKTAASADEFLLFDDEPAKPAAVSAPVRQVEEPVAVAPKPAAKAADEFLLFDDEAPKKPAAQPAAESVAETAPVASASASAVSVAVEQSAAVPLDAEAQQKIDALMQNKAAVKQLRENMLRVAKTYEEYLYYGNFLFVGRTHSRLTGPYLSARTLVETLPMAMRTSTSGEDLKAKLEKQNIFFLDSDVCNALYANRLTFLEIEERRKAMQTAVPPPKRK